MSSRGKQVPIAISTSPSERDDLAHLYGLIDNSINPRITPAPAPRENLHLFFDICGHICLSSAIARCVTSKHSEKMRASPSTLLVAIFLLFATSTAAWPWPRILPDADSLIVRRQENGGDAKDEGTLSLSTCQITQEPSS